MLLWLIATVSYDHQFATVFFFDGHLSRFHDTIHFKMRKLSYASLPSLKNVVSHNKQSNDEGKGATMVA